MKANCWYGKGDVQIVDVSEPEILNSRDAVIKVTSTAICGSDLHLYNGLVPTMEKGDILGHEFMGEVVEVGNEVHSVKAGDRVVASFPISCGNCFFCQKELFSLCENYNPNAWMAQQLFGHSPAGIYGYTHMLGGYAGYVAYSYTGSFIVAVIAGALFVMIVGVRMERIVIRHFYDRPAEDQILVTFGLGIVFVEVVRFFFGSLSLTVPGPPWASTLSPAVSMAPPSPPWAC